MKINRTKNAARNMVFGTIISVYQIIVPFIMRTIIIYRMGASYAGLNNLFGSVLSVLNLAELGIGAAMNFSMYRPITEDDTDTICALMNLYRKYYAAIGTVILAAGLILTPVMPKLVKTDTVPADINIYILYYLYLFSCAVSYWMYPDRVGLLAAHQRSDVTNKVTLVTGTIAYALQILVLIFWKNFYLYTLAYMLIDIVYHFVLAVVVDRMYPSYRPRGDLNGAVKKEIHGRIRDLFTSKVGSVVVESVDTVVVSAYLGLTVLAIFQNYQFILNAVLRIVMILFNACLAGIGNSLVAESMEKNYRDLKQLTFITAWITGFCCVCLLCLYQPLMEIWVGRDLMLKLSAVVCFVVYFYVRGINQLLDTYKDAAGIWHADRFRPLVTAFLNLAMNLTMVRFIGIYGILLSTVLSVLLVGLPWEMNNLFSGLFDRELKNSYALELMHYALMAAAACAVTYGICAWIPLERWGALIVRGIICCIVPNLIFFLCYRKKTEFAQSVDLADHITGGRLRFLQKLK